MFRTHSTTKSLLSTTVLQQQQQRHIINNGRCSSRRTMMNVTHHHHHQQQQQPLQLLQQQGRPYLWAGLAVAAGGMTYVTTTMHSTNDTDHRLTYNAGLPVVTDDDTTTVKDQEENAVVTKFSTYWPRYILILFGPPGAGKGTHGPKIESLLQVPQLSTGDMLRAAVSAQSEIGKQAAAVMKAGGLVSDEIVIGIIRDRIQQKDCALGFILDGFPRTLGQAMALDDMLAQEGAFVTKVIELQVPDEVLEERICGRWIHKSSGRSYHVKYAPPQSMQIDATTGQPIPESMKDDTTQELLMQRPDDTASALVKRLQGYHTDTVPILDHYAPKGIVRTANANQNMEQVWEEVLTALQRGGSSPSK